MLTLFLSRVQLNVGWHYAVVWLDGVVLDPPHLTWTHPRDLVEVALNLEAEAAK